MIIDLKKISESGKIKIKIVLATIIALAVLSAIFQAGIFVGFHKASFLFSSGDNFYKAYGNRNDRLTNGARMMGGGFFRDEFSGGHGAIGKILKVSLPTIVVLGPDNIEKIVLINENTDIRQQREVSTSSKLMVDQLISVLGTPNDQGQIVAKFIRIVPSVPFASSSPAPISTSTINLK